MNFNVYFVVANYRVAECLEDKHEHFAMNVYYRQSSPGCNIHDSS